MSNRIPPGSGGIDTTLQMLSNPYQFGKSRFERYGPISKIKILGKPTVILLGAEAQKYVLATNYRNFLWREGYGTSAIFFGNALTVIDGDEHDQQRRLMTPAFHGRHMGDYLDRMNRIISTQFASWPDSGQRKAYLDIREIAFRLSASILLGLEVGPDYERLNQLWGTLADGVISLVRIDLPFTRYGKALRAGKKLDAFMLKIIQERRQTPSTDAAGLLVHSRDEDGSVYTDQQLIDQIKFLITAGYDTTASTAGWLIVELLRHPNALQKVCAEINADAKDAPVSLDDVRQKPYLDAAIKETLRLYPQSFIIPRGVKEAFDIGDYHIPAGWGLILVPSYTQRMPEYFTDPDEFQPERFLAPRDEDAKHPFAWVGFGGGPRICIGAGVAQIEVKALVTRFFRQFTATLVTGQDLNVMYRPVPRAKGDIAIDFARKK